MSEPTGWENELLLLLGEHVKKKEKRKITNYIKV
jgi:hypothetical protein